MAALVGFVLAGTVGRDWCENRQRTAAAAEHEARMDRISESHPNPTSVFNRDDPECRDRRLAKQIARELKRLERGGAVNAARLAGTGTRTAATASRRPTR